MKIFPELFFAAKKNKETAGMIGGLKYYFVAKHYDRKGGSGLVHEREFKKYFFQTVRHSRATYYRWKKQARELGLFEDHGRIMQLVSWGRAGLMVGCRRISRPVEVSLRGVVDNQGLSEVWAGYIKRHEPKEKTEKKPAQKAKPIAKSTLRKLTGIPENTQRYYNKKAGVRETPNVADLGNPENPPAEEAGGFYAKYGRWRQRLGNTPYAPTRIKACKPGRTSKINRTMNNETLSPMSGSDRIFDRSVKLYFHPRNTDEKIEKYLAKKIPEIDAQKRPVFVYGYNYRCSGFAIWSAVDTETGVRA